MEVFAILFFLTTGFISKYDALQVRAPKILHSSRPLFRMSLMMDSEDHENSNFHPTLPLFREFTDDPHSSSLLQSEVCDYCILTALAQENIELGNYERAVKLAKEAIVTAEHTNEQNNIYSGTADGICADALYAIGAYRESADHYKRGLKMYETTHRSNRDPEALRLVGATHLIAHNFLIENSFKEAASAWSKALGMTDKLLGSKDINVAGCMVNLAICHIKLGDIGPAPEGLLLRALHIYDEQKEDTFDSKFGKKPVSLLMYDGGSPVATTYGELGNLYVKRGHDGLAAKNFYLVEEMYEQGLVPDEQAANALENLGVIEWRDGNLKGAEKHFDGALSIIRKLPNPEHYKSSYAINLMIEGLRAGKSPPSRISSKWQKLHQLRDEEEWKEKNISY